MKIRSQTFSALKALLDLSQHASGPSPAPLAEVARRQGLSLGLLEQLFRGLKKAGLVEPWRGVRGGYRLARRPDKLRLLDVFRAVDEPLVRPAPSRSNRDPEGQVLEKALAGLDQALEKELAALTLADLRRNLRDHPSARAQPGQSARFSI